jgi:hypothetical protein
MSDLNQLSNCNLEKWLLLYACTVVKLTVNGKGLWVSFQRLMCTFHSKLDDEIALLIRQKQLNEKNTFKDLPQVTFLYYSCIYYI